jgi:hypothetical protein
MAAPGFARVARAVLHAHGLSGQAKLVYTLMASRLNEQGECWPSLPTLAEESGWSRPTVIKAIDELVGAGLVERQRRGKTQANLYRVKSTTFTSPPGEVKHVDDTTDGEVKHVDLETRVKSTTFTSEVNRLYPNVPHLTSTTGNPLTPVIPVAAGGGAQARAPAAAAPAELSAFHAVLDGLPGYQPTAAFFTRVTQYAANGLDVEEEAIKMASWLQEPKQRRAQRQCSVLFMLKWLKREKDRPNGTPQGDSHTTHGPRRVTGRTATAADVSEFDRYSHAPGTPRSAACADRAVAYGDPGSG